MQLAEKQLIKSHKLKSLWEIDFKVEGSRAGEWYSECFLRDGTHGTKLEEAAYIQLSWMGYGLTKAKNISEPNSFTDMVLKSQRYIPR